MNAKKGVATSTAKVPAALAGMAAGLAASVATSAEGTAFMKFTKFGEWVFGAQEDEVEENSHWAINPQAFGHGWIAWGDAQHDTEGEMLGEIMGPATQALPPQPEPVEGRWTEQRAIHLACINGEDEGVQVMYKTNSQGGLKAYNAIIMDVVKRIQAGNTDIVPVVELLSDDYNHKTYGKIFTPVLKVIEWVSTDQATPAVPEEIEEEELVEEEEEPPTPRRRRRKAA